jgi:hypothetical protein
VNRAYRHHRHASLDREDDLPGPVWLVVAALMVLVAVAVLLWGVPLLARLTLWMIAAVNQAATGANW